jgi:alpha-beta hydrolase superfamily lysophospholipase
METFSIQSRDNVLVKAYSWLPESKPVAIVQIAHGMQEYARRYEHFAKWLNGYNIGVYANDHIGHGSSINTMDEISDFPGKDDWQRSVEILSELTGKIRAEHPGIPLFILGHSMGSVMVQTYMISYGDKAEGYILSGAIRQPAVMASLGIGIARILSAIFGRHDRSRLIIALGYGQYNRHFRPNRTGADWLCSNDKTVDDYIESPLCGVPLTNNFYRNFFTGFRIIANKKNLIKIPKGKPVLIIAGKSDPAGFFGKAPLKISKLLTKYAKANVELKLYPGCRHEILNEKIKEEVYNDILVWISGNIIDG